MKKAKTTNKLILILSALLCAVFAFTIGITFASSAMVYNYGTNTLSTKAYLANQQYVVVNDTQNAPIPYSVGVHATEVALEYAIDYAFDLCVKYSLKCSYYLQYHYLCLQTIVLHCLRLECYRSI